MWAARDGEPALAVGLPDHVEAWYPALEGLRLDSARPYGTGFAAELDAAKPARVLVLYPYAMNPGVADALRTRGFVLERSYPGWIDQGRGEVRTYVHGPSGPTR